MAAVVGSGRGDAVVVVAGLADCFCAVGVEGVSAAAMNHHEPKPMPATSPVTIATNSPRTINRCRRTVTGEGARRC